MWRISDLLKLTAIGERSAADCVFEGAGKILRILISQRVSDFAYRFVRHDKHVFGEVHRFLLYVVQGIAPGLFLYQISEIIGRQAKL